MTNGECIYHKIVNYMFRMAHEKDDFRRFSVIWEFRVTGNWVATRVALRWKWAFNRHSQRSEARSNDWSYWPKRKNLIQCKFSLELAPLCFPPEENITLRNDLPIKFTCSISAWLRPFFRKFGTKGICGNFGGILSNPMESLRKLGTKKKQPSYPKGGKVIVWYLEFGWDNLETAGVNSKFSAAVTSSLQIFTDLISLKEKQMECIWRITCLEEDVLVVFPTGFDKRHDSESGKIVSPYNCFCWS